MFKIDVKRILLDVTFLDCLVLTFCYVIGDGWDNISPDVKFGRYSCLKSENMKIKNNLEF